MKIMEENKKNKNRFNKRKKTEERKLKKTEMDDKRKKYCKQC